ncbi:hypothetical protein JOY44_00235 [Phormidium sp. CLA17]|uniref:hypothetical protein n=1 Tax=Leptolyngbya sp. Cla-17 TaxID=2803751 RepID=UPI0014924D4C|nr:hypothetical protein [Leptolyngbya sp. Cla-17]MBM0740083.1 hypothetical protein [Leptolyngbya sp. Cla-17]
MKWNSTIGLTLILLVSMLIAGVFSGIAGTSIGREALKGITQPDTRPNNLANRKGDLPRKDEVLILPEDKIIANVKTRISGGKAAAVVAKPVSAATSNVAAAQAKFPLTTESEDVTLEIRSVQQQGDSLIISVSLRNASKAPVKFLYSFLEVKDNQNRTLSANTEELPSELPADNQVYAGIIRLPMASVDKAEKLSLALSDYPDQKVQLEAANIPVVR